VVPDDLPDIESTWATRELPVLAAALRRLDSGERGSIRQLAEIGAETGIPPRQLLNGLAALESADPPYLEVEYGGGWSDENYGGGYVSAISERARRELGSWPSANELLDQLVGALSAAADAESEPERKSRLRGAADALAGMARDIAVNVISARLGRID
jgi:hypothetical protein